MLTENHKFHNSSLFITNAKALSSAKPARSIEVPWSPLFQYASGVQPPHEISANGNEASGSITLDLASKLDSGESAVVEVIHLMFTTGNLIGGRAESQVKVALDGFRYEPGAPDTGFSMACELNLGEPGSIVDVYVILAERSDDPAITRKSSAYISNADSVFGSVSFNIVASGLSINGGSALNARVLFPGSAGWDRFVEQYHTSGE